MQVTRETVNKAPHLITDFMYNNDNVGINLNLINDAKTHKKIDVPAIPIDYSPVSINNTNNRIIIATDLKYNNDNIQIESKVEYANETKQDYYKIDDNTFANDIINTCIVDKKDIKNMPCYLQTFEEVKKTACENALEQNFLIKTPVLDYKCYVYSDNMELLGVANRLMSASMSTRYTMGEYVGKKLTEYEGKNIVIDLCINNNVTLQLEHVKIMKALDSSLSYIEIDTERTTVKRLADNYDNINIKLPQGFNIPEYKVHYSIDNYYEQLLIGNSPNNIEKFFKDNKPNTSVIINLNKYLIS